MNKKSIQIVRITEILKDYDSAPFVGPKNSDTLTVHLEGRVHAKDLKKLLDEETGLDYLKRSGSGVTLTFKAADDV